MANELDKTQMLRFSTCQYIDEGRHIILKGASGNGKTYIACALGNAACRHFRSVRHIRMPKLWDSINVARSCGELQKLLKAYKKVDPLIIDEWLILELLHTRRKKSSTVFCSQYHDNGWYDQLGGDDSPLAEAILDRIKHDAYKIHIVPHDPANYRSMREMYCLDKSLGE